MMVAGQCIVSGTDAGVAGGKWSLVGATNI